LIGLIRVWLRGKTTGSMKSEITMDKPPAIPQPKPPEAKSVRFAATLNMILPGTGQFYLGQRILGFILAGTFLTCLIAMFVIFFVGYAQYLRVAINPMEGQELESLANVFHVRWQIGLLIVSVVVWIASLAGLARAKAR